MSKLDNPVFDEEDLCIESLAGKAGNIAKATWSMILDCARDISTCWPMK
jgi:hypothetical protein